MKILKILYSGDEGGVLQAEVQYLKELRNNGVEIHSIIVGDERNKVLYESLSDLFVHIPATNLTIKGNVFEKLKIILQLRRWGKKSIMSIPQRIKEQSYSGIIFGRLSFMFLAYYLTKIEFSQVYYFMHKGIGDPKTLPIYKFLFRRLDIVPIANSEYTKLSFNGFCKNVLYPGFDETRTAQYYKGKTYREELKITDDAIVFGIAGRICDFKAQDWIAKILLDERFSMENFVLLLAGVIQDNSVLERVKINAGDEFERKIIYLGDLSDISKFYASIDVLINSGKNVESFGISVVEAMASGLPIVASNRGGTAETVQDGYNGWAFEGFSINSYKDVLTRVFNDRDKIKEYGENSLHAANKFSVKKNVGNFIKLLEN